MTAGHDERMRGNRVLGIVLAGWMIEVVARLAGWLSDIVVRDSALSAEARLRAAGLNLKHGFRARHVGRHVVLDKPSRIVLERGVSLRTGVVIIPGGAGTCRIGAGSHIGHRSVLAASGDLTIGPGCAISSGVLIYTVTNETGEDGAMPGAPPRLAPVVIGQQVHVGAGAVILPGVTVADRAVLGAGAVVTGDVAAGRVVAGVPAREMKGDA